METSFFPFALLFLIANIFSLTASATLLDLKTDEEALVAFRNAVDKTSDPNGVLSSNWSTNTSICSWIGVSCGLQHRRVTALNLSGFELVGTIAPHLGNLTFLQHFDISSNNFTGSIPSELSNLRRLKELNVGFNNLNGEIPSWFEGLSKLQVMNLRNNSFSGRIPSGIFTNMSVLIEIDLRFNMLSSQLPSDTCRNTPKLRGIYLRGNQLYGKIPASIYKCREVEVLSLGSNQFNGSIPSEIGNLTMLRSLYIYSNYLQGNIPSSIFNISSLELMDLSNNNLYGSIPTTLNNLPLLQELYLSKNNLTGGIPNEVGGLTSLIYMYLDQNNLAGLIPKQIGNLTSLVELDLSLNKLAGELPEELGILAYLEVFQASFNDLLNGSIPSSIFNISTLKTLALQQNLFSGSLPPNMGLSLLNLEELYLYFNRLSGQIPSSINNASKLTMLELNRNSFTGSIPDFGNLRHLKTLRLWENNLTGAESPTQELRFLSSLTNCRDLEHLEISDNPLMNGILPASVGNLSTSLVKFAAANCSIRGVIPSEIGNLSSLQVLDLSENRLTEFIPATLGKLKKVETLYLHGNQLQGHTPRDLCQINKLGYLCLSYNMLTGSIPECLGEIKSLSYVSFASNSLNSTLPPNFLNLTDLIYLDLSSNNLSGPLDQIVSLRHINKLNLSSNKFSGDIPSSIDGCESLEFLCLSNNMFNGSIPESLGEVKGLRTLDLSNNHLSGLIPNSLGEVKGLSTLDLSNNYLSGLIPNSLESLDDLQHFNVSNNQLEGEIPDGGRFAEFNAQSFLNNSALCGTTRFQVQPCKKNPSRSTSELVMKYILPPFIGVMILMVGILVLIRRRRVKKSPPAADFSSMGVDWKIISERELRQRTDCFSERNLLGKGRMGSVYKATLADETEVAVKVFDLQSEGATKSFETESHILSNIRHRNLVKILGCCSNMEFKALILAYMPNGSLEKWLQREDHCLDLMQRLNIATDVASAVEYLHHGHTHTVVHCDIKPGNVLLDVDMTAHVGDFGISKLFDNGVQGAIDTKNMATIGYAAPECGSGGKISTSRDVYSYGILLLEMFTSKRPTDDMFTADMTIKEWVGKALQENMISEVVASGLLSGEDRHFSAELECVKSIFDLAMKCLALSPGERITMIQVVAALQKIKAKVPVKEPKKMHQR
ncbi:hypothetical protein C2S51_014989 [Perilla frutescens var. frutescens]|nr:hypothetical protein C2S51_014989 [Perilla frutescens var. frutescens]